MSVPLDEYYRYNPYLVNTLNNIKGRVKRNPSYTEKGISNYLELEDLRELFMRDKGFLMRKPSIDRIDSNKDYDISNCRFIETIENSKRKKSRKATS